MDEKRPCRKCGGNGRGRWRECPWCDGHGYFPTPRAHAELIAKLITNSRTGRLRRSRPRYAPEDAPWEVKVAHRRAWYIWRMARFHGGADVCMPVMAMLDADGDPYIKELDKVADRVARAEFGTDMAAAARWGQALGYIDDVPDGLPASAYSMGPVVTVPEVEPEEEE